MPDSLLNELYREAVVTRRVLERVPGDKLEWRPHPKSMSLGQLAMHVASIPGDLSGLAQADEFDASQANFTPPAPGGVEEVLTTHNASLKAAQDYLGGVDEQTAQGSWRFTFRGKEVFTAPRGEVIRMMLNHWYHHRGQLSVYLRLLDVPVPVIYGRSADENPFD